jgi:hypothetical protein
MEQVSTAYKCPRCAVTEHPFVGDDRGARSRVAGEEPSITVCTDCREREVFRGSAKLPPIHFDSWPVDLADLLIEDALRYRYRRAERVPNDGVLAAPGKHSA